jgi:hypothetical protein
MVVGGSGACDCSVLCMALVYVTVLLRLPKERRRPATIHTPYIYMQE